MTVPLPRRPNLEYLKKQAKQLLAAQRNGSPQCCQFLRKLHRFAGASDKEILGAKLTLADTQFVVALFYGFDSWARLRDEVRSYPKSRDNSLDAVVRRCKTEIPQYAGAGVPLAVVAALNHSGIDIDFMEFAAASGWAFSFSYQYVDISPAFMGVRGNPKNDGPFEVFAFLPLQFGFDYVMARTAEPDRLWEFVMRHVGAGTPIMSEHMDGGLITDYREREGQRQIFFDGTVMPGWIDVDKLNPYAVYALVSGGDCQPEDRIRSNALRRALAKGQPHSWDNTPQGLAALRAYLADVSDQAKDFSKTEEWFCWAAFERLMARRCCEVWLRSTAERLPEGIRTLLLSSAARYGEAFKQYERYLAEVRGEQPTQLSLRERARTPERIAAIVPILEEGIAAESDGLALLARAVETLE